MACAYIIYSKTRDRYYIGATSGDIAERLSKHNSGYYGAHYTATTDDWELMAAFTYPSFSQARRLELYLKRMKSRRFIERIIDHPEEAEKLYRKFGSGLFR